MNGNMLPTKGLAESAKQKKPVVPSSGGLASMPGTPFPLMSEQQPVNKQMLANIAKEDMPIEPVYSMSPTTLKHGLAAMLASMGLGM